MHVAYLTKPHYDETGYDKVVVNESNKLFAVFDGMGVSEDSRFASSTAAENFENFAPYNYESLKQKLDDTNRLVSLRPQAGTTATAIFIDGAGTLHYVHIGDSRLYVMNGLRLKQITADEGVGNVLFNYVGSHSKGVCQLGTIENWSKFMLCSDGVTGDWLEQQLSDQEIERVLVVSETPQKACDTLVSMSKKDDDKSVIVGYK